MRRTFIVLALLAIAAFAAFFPYTRLPKADGLAALTGLMHGSGYTRDAEDSFRRLFVGFVIWLAFTVYWNTASKDAAPTRRTESQWSSRVNAIMWSGALLILFLPIPGLTRRFLPGSYFWRILGLAIEVSGMLLALWARRELGHNWSAGVRIAADHHLIHTGPYQLVRHPIYTAMLCIFLGLALQSGQLHALLALPLFAIRYWRKIRTEENLLEETFGAEYEVYRQHTWAVVPYVY